MHSAESSAGQLTQILEHAVTTSGSKAGPSGRQSSHLVVSDGTVSGSVLQLHLRGNLERERKFVVFSSSSVCISGKGELLFLEATFCELSYSLPSRSGTDCLLDLRAEVIYISDPLISETSTN